MSAGKIEDFKTVPEAAKQLGVPTYQIIQWIKKEKITAIRKGWTWLIHKNNIKKPK